MTTKAKRVKHVRAKEPSNELYERCYLAALTGVLAGWLHGGNHDETAPQVAASIALEACEHLLEERAGITAGGKGKAK